jgi:adenylate cyclase class 2
MSYNNTEIEVKFSLFNVEEVINFLNSNAEKISENILQKDTYLTPQHKNFLDTEFPFEWLRIRESNKGICINYKHFYPENKKEIDYCDEFETKVIDPIIIKILSCLDFKELVVVEKKRTTWIFKNVEIAIDEVNELGKFIELEITTHFDNPKKAKEFLYELVNEIGANVGEEDYRGYPFLLLEKRGYKFNQ